MKRKATLPSAPGKTNKVKDKKRRKQPFGAANRIGKANDRIVNDSSKPILVSRIFVSVDCTGKLPIAFPDVQLLANKRGWELLAKICSRRARQADDLNESDFTDPTDHEHLASQLNCELSDRMEFTLRTITDNNCSWITSHLRVQPATAQRGSFAEWGMELGNKARVEECASKLWCLEDDE